MVSYVIPYQALLGVLIVYRMQVLGADGSTVCLPGTGIHDLVLIRTCHQPWVSKLQRTVAMYE